jgi:hypothetical protein
MNGKIIPAKRKQSYDEISLICDIMDEYRRVRKEYEKTVSNQGNVSLQYWTNYNYNEKSKYF